MNQKCFHATGNAADISSYINSVIQNRWKIVSINTVFNGCELAAIILAEEPTVSIIR